MSALADRAREVPDRDEDCVLVAPEARSPFAGMTLSQARVLNAALIGLPVEVYGGRFPHTRFWEEGRGLPVYVFDGMVLPGEWRLTPFHAEGDLELRHVRRVDGHYLPVAGSTRVLSAALVKHFTVLATYRQYRVCDTCGKRMPLTEKVYDVACLGEEWSHRWECRTCWWSG